MGDRFEKPETREQIDHMNYVEATTAPPQRLQREYISWIRGGMSNNQSERLFGHNSPGGFDGINRQVTVPVDLREVFYDDLLTQAFLSVYNDVTASMPGAESREIRQQLATSADRMIELIVSIAGSSAREQSEYGFELAANDRGRNVMTYEDMVKVQIAFDQFGVLAAFPEENKVIDMATEIVQGQELSDETLQEISSFRLSAMNRLDTYNSSLQRAENETIAMPIDVREDARAYGALLMLMNRPQLEQLIDYEIDKLEDGADLQEVLDQVYLITMNTDIAPGVVFRKLTELATEYTDSPGDLVLITETIEKIENDRARLAAELSRVNEEFMSNLEVGDLQTFGKRGTFLNLLAILWGMTTATLSILKAVTNPASALNHSFYIASGVGVANFAYNRMRGGRGTEGFERLAQRITMSPDARAEYGKEAVTAEAAALTAQEVGFRITRDFYANPDVIKLIRQMKDDGREQFTIEQFETAFRNESNISTEAREAYTRYRTSTNDDYLFTALNFAAHSYNMLDVETTEDYVREIGSRVGLRNSDFVTN